MRMTTPDHTKWMVAICAKVFQKDSIIGRSELIELVDPSTGESRHYVLVQQQNSNNISNTSEQQQRQQPSKMIVEIQSLEEDFSSFFVGRHVVKDGNLYILNPVDPLFFLFRQSTEIQSSSASSSSSWQPFDQTLELLTQKENGYHIRKCLSEKQLGHICMSLCNDQTDNIPYYKFSEKHALQWLHKKQDLVYQVLVRQEKTRGEYRKKLVKRLPKEYSVGSGGGGSVSSTFYTPDDGMTTKPKEMNPDEDERISPKTLHRLKMESLQIISNYLSEEWTTKFIDSYEVSENEVFPVRTDKKSLSDSSAMGATGSPTTTSMTGTYDVDNTSTTIKETPKSKTVVESSRSIANKRLEKVNKRGMSSLTSFFQPKAKKPTL